jgi:hypothetical protein
MKRSDMVLEFLASVDRLQEAVAEYQMKLAVLTDHGQRMRSMVEMLGQTGGDLNDPDVMRLPAAIIPKTNGAAAVAEAA